MHNSAASLLGLALSLSLLGACGTSHRGPSDGGAGGSGGGSAGGSAGGSGGGAGGGGTGGSGADGGSEDGGTADGGVDAGTHDLLGGKILFRGLTEGIGFEAEIYRVPIAAPAPVVYGDGHCDVALPPSSGDDILADFFRDPSADDLDLGATITASDGTNTLVAQRAASGNSAQYQIGAAGPPFAFSKTWTLTNSGAAGGVASTTLATIFVPSAVALISGAIDPTAGPVIIQYSGGAGASFFHINLANGAATIDCYPAPDSTSFTLPSGLVHLLDRFVVPSVSAESISWVTVNGNPVRVRVTSDYLD